MPTAQDVVNMALSQLGVGETPPGSNITKYGAWYGLQGQPWCAMFVMWCFNQLNALSLIHTNSAYVPTMYTEMVAAGMGVPSGQPGDIVCFAFDPGLDHVGIVETRITAGVYRTIEGNTGDAVQRHTRANGGGCQMVFCRPAYSVTPTPQPKPREDEMSAYTFSNVSNAVFIDCYRDKYNYFVTTDGITTNLVFTAIEHETGKIASTAGQPNPPEGKSGPHDHNIQDILNQGAFQSIKGSFKLIISCNQPINISIREVVK